MPLNIVRYIQDTLRLSTKIQISLKYILIIFLYASSFYGFETWSLVLKEKNKLKFLSSVPYQIRC
jgi:hypothetical protein